MDRGFSACYRTLICRIMLSILSQSLFSILAILVSLPLLKKNKFYYQTPEFHTLAFLREEEIERVPCCSTLQTEGGDMVF